MVEKKGRKGFPDFYVFAGSLSYFINLQYDVSRNSKANKIRY